MGEFLTGLWTAMDICSTQFIWRTFFSRKVSQRRYCLALFALWAAYQIVFDFFPFRLNAWQKFIATSVLYTGCSLFINTGTWYSQLIATMFYIIFFGGIDNIIIYGAAVLFGSSVTVLMQDRLLYALVGTAGKTIGIYLAWAVYHFQRGQKLRLLRGKWLVFTALYAASSAIMLYAIAYGFQDTDKASVGVVLLSFAAIAVSLILLYLIHSLAAATEQLRESSLLNQQVELQARQLQALEQSIRAQRDLTHDFRNHLLVLRGLLAAGETEKVRHVIDELLGGPTERIFAVRTGNAVLDALLNQKYREANAQGVDMQLRVNDLSDLPLPENQLIVLLSNLLDNAIEGSLRTDGYKEVLVTLAREEEAVFLAVRNPSLPVELVGNRCETSKPDKINHGYGMGKILTIFRNLQASYSIRYDDGEFRVAAELPLNPQPEEKLHWWQFRKRFLRWQERGY